ncbi:MAG: DUF6288 domain-containing protein [Kiritimatiellae bacterium]|nr:DUF6288 domain-containing protein [Kiritimatiellia bacterium]
MKTIPSSCLVGLLMCGSLFGVEVGLTVEERLGVSRLAEPVTSGVPFPKGALKDILSLRLVDQSGRSVPAQFTLVNKWWQDGSVKWVHLDFQPTVMAGSKAVFTLKDGGSAVASPSLKKVSVARSGSDYIVNTGLLQFRVRQEGFNLFDTLSLNGRLLVPGDHKGGFELKIGSETYSPAFCRETTIEVEEPGPMKAVLLVKGRNVRPDGSGYGMDYKCRIYAFADSSRVKVVYTVENRRGAWNEHVAVSDWRLVLPTRLGGEMRYAFGLSDKPVGGHLRSPVLLEVPHTDVYRLSGTESKIEGNPHEEEPPWLGTLDLRGSDGGVTLGVKHFWQKWAKYLALTPDGKITVGFWTDRVYHKGETTLVDSNGCVQFYAGIASTHELWFNFDDGNESAPFARIAAVREPLFARCDPTWYCRASGVFGDLSEADLDVYLPEWRDRVAAFNRWAERAVQKPLQRWKTARTPNGKVDSYGLLNWGDGVEEITGNRPEDVHWEGGYYDYMHSILLNFARTGDLFYLWTAATMSRHNADVHHTHHDQHPGRSRYCPSFEHIRMDEKGRPPYASGTFNHWKNLSAFELWYLLGDHRSREAAMETMKWAVQLGNSGIDFGQPRSICHGILGLWAGYDCTGDKTYLEALGRFARATAEKIVQGTRMGSGAWQRGMAIQGLCWYVEQTGDESVVPAIEKALQQDEGANADELAYGWVFMWKRTGDPRHFIRAAAKLRERSAEQWMQRFGNQGRSLLYVPTIVRKDAPRKPPAQAQ